MEEGDVHVCSPLPGYCSVTKQRVRIDDINIVI